METKAQRKETAITDKDRMDWLEKSLFHREKNDWDKKYAPNSTMWVLFAPDGVQGSARRIVDAAIERERRD